MVYTCLYNPFMALDGVLLGLPWVFHMKRSIQLVGPEMSFFSEACTLVIRHIAANLGHGLRVFFRGWEACFDGNNNGGSKCMANVGKTWWIYVNLVSFVSKTLFESGFNDNFKVPSLGHTMWKHLCKWFGCACARPAAAFLRGSSCSKPCPRTSPWLLLTVTYYK